MGIVWITTKIWPLGVMGNFISFQDCLLSCSNLLFSITEVFQVFEIFINFWYKAGLFIHIYSPFSHVSESAPGVDEEKATSTHICSLAVMSSTLKPYLPLHNQTLFFDICVLFLKFSRRVFIFNHYSKPNTCILGL